MQDFIDKKIVLGVCGGIAAYKSAWLVRELTRLGAQVRVVMTDAAQQFITPLTMQALSGNEVRCELFDEQAERAMGHIELARWANYLLIAPATANCLAKLVHGMADDLLSTLYLVNENPVIICPAMNRSMWDHPATRENCDKLLQRGNIIVPPEHGAQACGEVGAGRLAETEAIINTLRLHAVSSLLQGHKVLITAGATREAIDPVRYISNRSSGRMGFALAQAAQLAGAQVTLVSGISDLPIPEAVNYHAVVSAKDMHNKVMECLQQGMIFIACSAVADYSPLTVAAQKIKKQQKEMTLTLVKNPDILADVAASGKASFVMGFAAETENLLANAHSKLINKKIDMIVANKVGDGLGFDSEENEVIVLTPFAQTTLPLMNKVRLAGELVAILATSIQNAALK